MTTPFPPGRPPGRLRRRDRAVMKPVTTTIAGIAIPDSAIANDATQFVRDTSTELLYVGAMFHDVLEAKVPGYVRPNFCDFIANSPFSE